MKHDNDGCLCIPDSITIYCANKDRGTVRNGQHSNGHNECAFFRSNGSLVQGLRLGLGFG